MDKTQFIKTIEDFYARGVALIKVKNADYATGHDPFQNFRSASVAGIEPARAILLRVLDKLARISNLLGKEAHVKDETIEDTLLDAANYLNILHAFLTDKMDKN